MEKTQLQMRIESSVRTGKTYPSNIHFVDTKKDRNKPFLTKRDPYSRYITEDEVKTAKTYEEIRPAIQSRLAQMEYPEDYLTLLKEYKFNDSKIGKLKARFNLEIIGSRNLGLKNKAIKNTIKRKGGILKLIWQESITELYNTFANPVQNYIEKPFHERYDRLNL